VVTHSSVFLRVIGSTGAPFIVHLDCNEPLPQYECGAWNTVGRNWKFDYIDWSKFSSDYFQMQLWRLKSGYQNPMRQQEKTALLKRIIENAPLEKSPDNEESVYQMRREQTEAARLARKLKAAKKSWTGKKRTSSRGGTLPSLD
jgi:hypothetical protein